LGAAVSVHPGLQVQIVDLYRRHARISTEEFWMRCFELGSMIGLLELDAILHEASQPTLHEHSLMAYALNGL
jgi:hypothetical protein